MNKKMFNLLVVFLLFSFLLQMEIWGCTNFLITRGASADGCTMISYAADSHVLYGELYYTPPGRHIKGSLLDVVEWDTGKYLGKIEQVEETFSVVGNINEHQVAIGETTYGGREELHNPKGIMDYGSLMYIMLQRARSAREGILIISDLVDKYGYCSEGERPGPERCGLGCATDPRRLYLRPRQSIQDTAVPAE
jgi:dipeptidase